ncbi:lysosome-associated membrane glycoprotein 2 isoform X1 [Tachysurus ichikawai]
MWSSSFITLHTCMLSSSAEECKADDSGNFIMPLAVGIALIVLVLLVLVAYFIGRQRSRTRSYEQFT